MKKIFLLFLFALATINLFSQGKPDWVDIDFRNMKFPVNVYFTGFAYGEISPKQTRQDAINQLITDAQADLIKKIRLQISAKSQTKIEAVSNSGKYDENETFTSQATTESNAEIVGMKTESYYDAKEKLVYAFAYAKKNELFDYYKSSLSINLTQIEGIIKTAQDLEAEREKAKARQQLENAKPLFSKARYAQEMLTAIDANTTPEELQLKKTESLYNQFTQMQAKLAQAVHIYVVSNEDLFGERVDIVTNKIKADLAAKGCSFTKEREADFKLNIKATTRSSTTQGGIVFCYADTSVELYDIHKQKVVFGDELTEKGGSSSLDKAGRKAMEEVAKKIAEKLTHWIQ